ncbi:MAG: hypothetical protein NZM40_04085 [Sphingomonadaceae bacterium]|uniref:hypothetical protein n=1 Tax=Thermaurantiacus sp. TaxID=2820283 RepID=UPI00298EF974|nr:hypothetical protein [Thermaurantiacus sp.]MCS6986605.1 hypothetical protein [Sphingomonadaceae bacterium]MDW8414134.1 hypothetical protein [Thermaurantiacus sp.]
MRTDQAARRARDVAAAALVGLGFLLSGCQRDPLRVVRSPCPAAAIPHHVGTLTRFEPPQSRNAEAVDFIAQLVDFRTRCIPGAEWLETEVRFRVVAQRRPRAGASLPARTEALPVFVALVQGGNVLVAKQVSVVEVHWPQGQLRGVGEGWVRADVLRQAATPPPEILARLERERRPDDEDALVDPMADPLVRAALRAATFEVLVGFQLDDAQLAYNILR